jgi:hypothetical protein
MSKLFEHLPSTNVKGKVKEFKTQKTKKLILMFSMNNYIKFLQVVVQFKKIKKSKVGKSLKCNLEC